MAEHQAGGVGADGAAHSRADNGPAPDPSGGRPAWRRHLDWTVVVPLLGLVVLGLSWGRSLSTPVLVLVAVLLVASVLAAVHHAEVIAHRVGEPLGSLVLAVAVTVIEVALIVTLTVSADKDVSTLARDTVFAAVMLTLNFIVGLSILIASLRHHLAEFNPEGTGAALSAALTLVILCFVVPRYTTTTSGPDFSPAQLGFAAVCSLAVYLLFLFTQTVRHRDFFLPVKQAVSGSGPTPGHGDEGDGIEPDDAEDHADVDSQRSSTAAFALLVAALVAVVGLAKVESAPIERIVSRLGLEHAFVGVVVAIVVLGPESVAAARAAYADRVQTSLNLAYGSCLACVGLTIPVIALSTIWIDQPLHLGLDPVHLVLLVATGFVSVLTVVPGRAKPLQAGLHLTLAAAFIFLTVQP
ncbi:MAG: ionic transporter y4hA [Nocardioides sp.]|uniref:calcium:proton antiporter n=1 Tax=Nocardioides sp. TaxID=35761 RepID=UPI0039E2E77D